MMKLQAMWQHLSGYKSSIDSFPYRLGVESSSVHSAVYCILLIKVKTHSAER